MTRAPDAQRPGGPSSLAAALILALLVFGVYRPTLRFAFVYDDHSTIVENLFLRSPANALRLLTPGPAAELVPDAGRPTLLLTELVDHALFGLAPSGRHAHSLLWHVAVAWLLFLLGRRWVGPWLAFAAAAVFAVHPLFVEAVAVLSNREDPIAAFFVLATLLVLRGSWGTPTLRRLAAMGPALLAALAKENAMVLPGLLLVFGGGSQDRDGSDDARVAGVRRHRLLDAAALLAVVGTAAGWRAWVMGAPLVVSRTAEVHAPDLSTRLGLGAWSLGHGLLQLLLPITLLPEYPDPPAFAAVVGGLGALVLAGISLALWRKLKALRETEASSTSGRPWPWSHTVGALLACGLAYAPHLGLIPLTNLRADRYFYLPGVFLCLAVVALVGRLPSVGHWGPGWSSGVPRAAWAALFGLLLVLGVRTTFQERIWRDDAALWTAGTQGAPGSARAWLGLAQAHLRRGETLRAAEAAGQAQRLSDDAETRELLGVIHLAQGDVTTALAHLEESLRRSSTRPGGRPTATLLNNLGYARLKRGDLEAARAGFAEARRLAPYFDRPWLNGAEAARALGRPAEARALLEELLRKAPDHIEARRALADLGA